MLAEAWRVAAAAARCYTSRPPDMHRLFPNALAPGVPSLPQPSFPAPPFRRLLPERCARSAPASAGGRGGPGAGCRSAPAHGLRRMACGRVSGLWKPSPLTGSGDLATARFPPACTLTPSSFLASSLPHDFCAGLYGLFKYGQLDDLGSRLHTH